MNPHDEQHIRQNLESYSTWGNMVIDKPPVKAMLDELDRLRFENARQAQQICDLEFSVDTIKLAYQQSEQRCAELEECLRVIADWVDVHSHLHRCFHTPEVAKWRTATDLALSQTSPKE